MERAQQDPHGIWKGWHRDVYASNATWLRFGFASNGIKDEWLEQCCHGRKRGSFRDAENGD